MQVLKSATLACVTAVVCTMGAATPYENTQLVVPHILALHRPCCMVHVCYRHGTKIVHQTQNHQSKLQTHSTSQAPACAAISQLMRMKARAKMAAGLPSKADLTLAGN